MKCSFGFLPDGRETFLYTIQAGDLTAKVTDFGATLVSLLVPDRTGRVDDVVLGYDDVTAYATLDGYLGATVGRNANRIGGACFPLEGRTCFVSANEGRNSLHSGPDGFSHRIWQLHRQEKNSVTFTLHSPHLDQGFPGNAEIAVTYTLDQAKRGLVIQYRGISDRDTVFNLTNHSYFNLAGHHNTQWAMEQVLILPGRHFTPADSESIPTGENRNVAGSPMDFRTPHAIGERIDQDYDALNLQGGYDHNWEVFAQPAAILSDPHSGREMHVITDRPGVQFYSGNYLNNPGKEGIFYHKRSGVCLETQFYPDSLNKPHWDKPIVEAGQVYRSITAYYFK